LVGVDGTFKLEGGAQCLKYVTFNPKAVGALTTTVTVSGAPGGSAVVTLTANGLGDLVITSSATGSGTTAAPYVVAGTAEFLVTNNGGSATKMLHTTVGGTNAALFVVISDTCFAQLLGNGESCGVTVQFVGTLNATTPQTATLTVSDGGTSNVAVAALKAAAPL